MTSQETKACSISRNWTQQQFSRHVFQFLKSWVRMAVRNGEADESPDKQQGRNQKDNSAAAHCMGREKTLHPDFKGVTGTMAGQESDHLAVSSRDFHSLECIPLRKNLRKLQFRVAVGAPQASRETKEATVEHMSFTNATKRHYVRAYRFWSVHAATESQFLDGNGLSSTPNRVAQRQGPVRAFRHQRPYVNEPSHVSSFSFWVNM